MIGSSHPRRSALLVAALALAVAAIAVGWRYATRPVLFLGPMVQQVTTSEFALFCGIAGADAVRARLYHDGQLAADGTVTHDQATGHVVVSFTGLSADRTYEYELSANGEVLARHAVRTAPTGDKPFRFTALGDTGVGDRHQYAIARHMTAWRPDLIIHTGDLIYPRGKPEVDHRKFFQPYAELLAFVPMYVALGNHEFRIPGYDPVTVSFIFPPNGPAGAPAERNYFFDYGNTRFVAVDSNDDYPFYAETVAPWLAEVLASAGSRWKVVFFHEPVYTQGKYPPAEKLLTTLVPVMDAQRVDLVLCGHNHMYERTHPLRTGAVVPAGEGTIHVTTGAGGANLAEARLPMPDTIAAWEDGEHSFTVVDVTSDVLSLRQFGESGRLIDEYHITREPVSDQLAPASRPG